MTKYISRAKFNDKGMIICCSQTECINCKDIDSCEELDFYIDSKYEGVNTCMKERSYKKVNGRVRQANH